ncbi:hypothetical protein HNY73_007800 [Argiope bruennichi]|uniref:Reverse transcriptase n=1 Tax=Argiope bruennichi TaxID=94029 RepID=A0A8T0FF13_ARGBR|nr:hypothetical protein HNY73_007800 [Argiope bruennichi]
MITKVASWEVLEEPSFSYHQFIQTTIRTIISSHIFNRFKTHGNHNKFQKQFQFHVEELINIIKNCNTQQELNEFTSLLQAAIIQAYNKTFKIKKQPLTENPTWWTNKLEIEKKRTKALRRRAQRSSSEERAKKYSPWKTEAKKYMKKVKRGKSVDWKDLCTEASNPYGKHFKVAFRKTIHPSQLTVFYNINVKGRHQKIAQNILEQIFPFPSSTPSLTHEITTTPNDCPFTEKEISQVIHNLPHGKSPGYDGIDNLILKTINKKFPGPLQSNFINVLS